MAKRQFLTIQTRLHQWVGTNPTDVDHQNIAKQVINDAYKELMRAWPWRTLTREGQILTVVPVSSGTITVLGNAVTGVGTNFTSNLVGGYMQIGGLGKEVHLISAVNTPTSIILETQVSADVTTASTYQIFQSDYVLAEGVDEEGLLYLVDTARNERIQPIPLTKIEREEPNFGSVTTSETPDFFSFVGRNANGGVIIRLFPIPNKAIQIRYVGLSTVVDLTADTDVPDIPERFENILEEGARAKLFMWIGKPDRFALHNQLFKEGIQRLIVADQADGDFVHRLREADIPDTAVQGRGLRLPSNFPALRFPSFS